MGICGIVAGSAGAGHYVTGERYDSAERSCSAQMPLDSVPVIPNEKKGLLHKFVKFLREI
jgi:hypothetical protein